MPVYKFRSVAEMPDPPWRLPGDAALYRSIGIVWTSSRAANPRRFPPGVHRYRSIEQMTRTRDEWEAEHIDALQRQREGR